MAQANQKPLYDPAVGIEEDFNLWSREQAALLRERRFDELDLLNIIEEIESLGRSDKRALISAYRVLIQHLLKWQFQPERRGASWEATIRKQRREIELIEADSPSLAAKAQEHVESAYSEARADAALETGLPEDRFPEVCAYSIAQIRDIFWRPALS